MDRPKTVVATWRSDATVLNMTIIASVIAAVLIVVAVVAFLTMSRRRNPPNKYVAQYQQPSLHPGIYSPSATQETKPKPVPKKKAPPETNESDESNNQ
jgi:hypothetical protein